MAAVEVETLRLPPSVLSVSVNTDRWKKQQLTVATEEVQAVEVTVAAVEVETLRLPLSPVSVSVDSHRWR